MEATQVHNTQAYFDKSWPLPDIEQVN
jgi:hypothetical protein